MVEMNRIRALTQRIAEEFRPERIILFGSHAYGRPVADSDVDLLVIMPFQGKGVRKSLDVLNRTDPRYWCNRAKLLWEKRLPEIRTA